MNKKSILFIVWALCFSAFLCGAIVSTGLNAKNESPVAVSSFLPLAFSFQKNLKFGDNSQDVRQLQIVLNSNPDTRLAVSGIGSNGQESTYFGQLTADAVMRFQEKYRKEVLDAHNIDAPTGFVGVATRGKLNQVISAGINNPKASPAAADLPAISTAPTVSPLISGAKPLEKEALPRLYTLRPQQIKKGDTFTLIGSGFENKNTIHIGSNTFPNILSQDGSNISFAIPAPSIIQNGEYEVWVENSQGVSKVAFQPINLTVTDSPQPSPVISSVLPSTVSGTEIVTVTGSGFTSNDNDIVSGFGTIKGVSSNGSQIIFSPRSLLTAGDVAQIPEGRIVKVDFYIVNSAGISNVFGSVNVKI